MAPSPIPIIGGGIGGLTLGLALKRRGISAVVYDRALSPPKYSYGITLYASSYRPLLGLLQVDEKTFREKVAVDAAQGGVGNIKSVVPPHTDAFRCHRGRLEELLAKDVAIEWDARLKNVNVATQTKTVQAQFDDGNTLDSDCLIGCDGPHAMSRQSLSKVMKLQVLPFVVFSGKTQISDAEYKDQFQEHLQNNALIQTHHGNVRLEVSVTDCSDSMVDMSYIYSRPARANGDPLHTPDRPVAGATDIPEEFFDELGRLENLPPPFNMVFDVEKVREDRLLHWLMRTVRPDLDEATRLAGEQAILIGDAVHATPILGGDGANAAVEDAVELADYIASKGTESLSDFSRAKYDRWLELVDASEKRIQDMHTPRSANL